MSGTPTIKACVTEGVDLIDMCVDRRALIAEMPAQLLADAAGRAGDGDYLVLELHFTRLRRPPKRRQSS